MTQQKLNYILMSLLLVATLVAGWFGMTLPVTPEIPEPLPVDLAPLEGQVSAIDERVEYLESQAISGALDSMSFRAPNSACYQMQGGREWVAGSGCTWTVEDGATLDLQSGSTLNISGFVTSTIDGLTVTGNAVITGTTDLQGNVSSSVGAVTVTDGLVVTGVLDAQGTIINSGGTLTINDHLDVANTLNYGTSDLYPIGSEDSNFQFSWGSDTITGSATLTQKVDSPTVAWCTISDVSFTATHCSTLIVGTTVTASVWLSDGTASPVGVDVSWLVIGVP